MSEVTAIVIGAGPAGALAAIILARARVSVLLIDQHRFPRDKVCGECLSSLGINVLRRLGLDRNILDLKPASLRRALIHDVDGDSIDLSLPREMWGISRVRFDEALVHAAREAGAEVRLQHRCERLEDGVATLRDLTTNRVEQLGAQWIVASDGKAALLPFKPSATNDLGLKAHFTGVAGQTDAIELFGLRGHYGGLARIENGLTNASFSVPQHRIRESAGDLDSLFRQMTAENPILTRRLRGAVRVSDWLTSALPRFGVQRDWPAGVLPVGNAAAAIEPIGGEGMGLAMRSAELAANAIVGNPASVDSSQLRQQYRQLWQRRSIACRIAARIISSPRLSRVAFSLAGDGCRLHAAMLKMLGKTTEAT